MVKTEISFERILGTFAPGALVTLGIWYSHRVFLLAYFPKLNGVDSNVLDYNLIWIKLALFIIASFCIGLAVNQLSDMGIAFLFPDESGTDKAKGKLRGLIRRIVRDLTLIQFNKDPRHFAVDRYLESHRKRKFLEMAKKWAFTDEKKINNKIEKVAVHQHIIIRLKILSTNSNRILMEEEFNYIFLSSLYVIFIFLFFNVFISYLTYSFGVEKINSLRESNSPRLNDIGIYSKTLLLATWIIITSSFYFLVVMLDKWLHPDKEMTNINTEEKNPVSNEETAKSKEKNTVIGWILKSLPKITLFFMILILPILCGLLGLGVNADNPESFLSKLCFKLFNLKLNHDLLEDMITSWIVWVGGTYFGIILFGYLLKRKFKDFCQHIIAVAIHFYTLESKGLVHKNDFANYLNDYQAAIKLAGKD